MTGLEQVMVQVYVKLIRAGSRTLESVPTNLRYAVQNALTS